MSTNKNEEDEILKINETVNTPKMDLSKISDLSLSNESNNNEGRKSVFIPHPPPTNFFR